MRNISCDDCVVSVLLEILPNPASGISEKEVNAISVLSEKGLVPPLRFAN